MAFGSVNKNHWHLILVVNCIAEHSVMLKQVWPLAMLALLCTEPRHKWQGSVFVVVVHTHVHVHYYTVLEEPHFSLRTSVSYT